MLLALSFTSTLLAQSYTDERFNAGRQALSYGEHQQAIIELRLACLGMLEKPETYAHCKSLLFLAQLGNRQRQAARATLLLIARLEETHSAYTNAPLDLVSRSMFEAAVFKNFSDERFQQTPRFAAALQQAVPPVPTDPGGGPQSLAALRRLASANPQDLDVQENLTLRLYHAEKIVDALKAAEELSSAEPENQNAGCIRATVRAARNRSLCSSYLDQITRCPEPLHTPFYVETRLRCYSENKDWNAGRDYLLTLSAASRAAAGIDGLARRISRRADPLPANEEAIAGSSVPAEVVQEPAPQAETPAAREPSPALLGQIAATRARAGKALKALDRESLNTNLNQARSLADQNPDVLEAQRLSGELAYLLTEWQITVDYLVRAQQLGDIGTSHTFYLAAAYHEVGRNDLAASFLQASLDRGLVYTEIVDTYKKKIFGQEP